MFPLILCSYRILCSHWSYVPIDPMFPLILCSHWSYVPFDPMFPLILCSHWSYVPTDPMFPLILCFHWSYVPTDPMLYCSYEPTDPTFLLNLRSHRFNHSAKFWPYSLWRSWCGAHHLSTTCAMQMQIQMQGFTRVSRGNANANANARREYRFHRFLATTAQFKRRWRRRRPQFRKKNFWGVKGNFLCFSTKVYQT